MQRCQRTQRVKMLEHFRRYTQRQCKLLPTVDDAVRHSADTVTWQLPLQPYKQ